MSASAIPDPEATEGKDSTRIGARLKAARLARRMTLSEVALSSGLTKGFLSKLERDLANASVASLIRLCNVLEIPIASLFEASSGELVRAGEYPPINFGGELLTEYLLTPRSEQRLQAILTEIEPGGGSGEELYSLPAEVELVLVLAGSVGIQLDTHEIELQQGDALTFSADTHHSFRNLDSEQMAKVLWVYSPALPERVDGTRS